MNGNSIVAVAIANEIRDRIMARQDALPAIETAAFFEGQDSGLEIAMEIIDDFITEVSNSGS